jgi:glycosidase
LLNGDYVALDESNPAVLSYLRRYKNEAVIVVLNMSSRPQKISFDVKPQGFTRSTAMTLLTTSSANTKDASLSSMSLQPFSVYIGKLTR